MEGWGSSETTISPQLLNRQSTCASRRISRFAASALREYDALVASRGTCTYLRPPPFFLSLARPSAVFDTILRIPQSLFLLLGGCGGPAGREHTPFAYASPVVCCRLPRGEFPEPFCIYSFLQYFYNSFLSSFFPPSFPPPAPRSDRFILRFYLDIVHGSPRRNTQSISRLFSSRTQFHRFSFPSLSNFHSSLFFLPCNNCCVRNHRKTGTILHVRRCGTERRLSGDDN
ncbi:hypothetical protein HOY82DRAFT_36877 [Tuber indicum]|nr:hypothetical protein HOY82DRAFT_36877 [Tuber indicum]